MGVTRADALGDHQASVVVPFDTKTAKQAVNAGVRGYVEVLHERTGQVIWARVEDLMTKTVRQREA